jgi:hypothetical protein
MGSELTIKGLLNQPRLWDFAAMKLRALAHRFLALWIAIGVVIGPAAPLMGAVPSALSATMTPAATYDDAMQMADDMPCCPDQTKSKSCDSCPFVALCMLTVSLPAPAGLGVLIERYLLRTAFATNNDQLIDGLGAKPPDYPPRTIV